MASDRGRDIPAQPSPNRDHRESTATIASGGEPAALAAAAVGALRADQRTRIDELGRRRLERAAQPLVVGWTPADLAARIAAERVDQAENLAAVLAAILRRYALELPPQEVRAVRQAAEHARRSQPPPVPCAHGDPSGCAACSFCRRGLADPDGERCDRCAPPVASPGPLPQAVAR